MRVLVAPDKFKGTLSAAEAAQAMALGVLDADPTVELDLCPIADGGEGSHEVVLAAGFEEVPVSVHAADGELHDSSFAVRENTAVLELARLCGAPTLRDGPSPWTSHTAGLGEAMLAAIEQGAEEVVLCIGGSASVDGGGGLLTALGYELQDATGAPVAPGLDGLPRVEHVVVPRRDLRARVVVVCDVATPLLGGRGGIRLYSAQKGLSTVEVLEAERRVAHWAEVTTRVVGQDFTLTPGGGSAGGVGFAAVAYLRAGFQQGLEYFDRLIDLPARVARADVVITGEGMFDVGSLDGKSPVGVAARAERARRPCLLVAGRNDLPPLHRHPFSACWALEAEVGQQRAIEDASVALREVAAKAYQHWSDIT